jgi:diguanylate cyclase (GGDEF)-like protein
MTHLPLPAMTRPVIEALSDDTYRDLTQIATVLFNVPMAAITILDGTTQWLRARQGLALEQTPRREAFCEYTVHSPSGQMVVNDARDDERFKEFPLVSGPTEVRFYAGVVLVTPDRETIGAMCVMDTRPRQASAHQMAALTALARQVVSLLELARSMEALERHISERAWYEERLQDSYRMLQQKTEHLTRQALSDPLTGIANRRAFEQDLARWQAEAKSGNCRFTLALVDLDHFKPLNDHYGHPAGDVVLRNICDSIRPVVSEDIVLARVGGDEFALLIRGSLSAAHLVLERVRQAVENVGTSYGITASIGATFFQEGDEANQMVVRADAALYRAKGQGRNRVIFGAEGA